MLRRNDADISAEPYCGVRGCKAGGAVSNNDNFQGSCAHPGYPLGKRARVTHTFSGRIRDCQSTSPSILYSRPHSVTRPSTNCCRIMTVPSGLTSCCSHIVTGITLLLLSGDQPRCSVLTCARHPSYPPPRPPSDALEPRVT